MTRVQRINTDLSACSGQIREIGLMEHAQLHFMTNYEFLLSYLPEKISANLYNPCHPCSQLL
jgi:hypothetical protein